MNEAAEMFLRIEAIFHEALAESGSRREALISRRSNGDPEIESEVYALLAAFEVEERLTASRAAEQEARNDAHEFRRIGPYQLDRLLGRGGMGAVYLAHRADGQFEQKVAIKLIDLPLATNLFRERFRQERQILAGLQHPYIARLLDGGVTAENDLYLALEYVDGVPIDRFSEERKLPVPKMLELFLCVCEAVQFAHHHLVVHRDLKPDNILVAQDGTPKLLDFGTAKLLSPALGRADSAFTREGYLSFTPQYASPEQVLENHITTASDTYSLGVLLYLLLTGVHPYERKELTTAEMLRVICEEPPRKPTQQAYSPDELDADLEAILLKALRKEPRDCYVNVEQFASDIRAHIEGRPVTARHGTLRYRAGKFIRRHKWGLAAAALLAVTLAAGVAGVVWQARVANQERRKAEARSADLRQLSNSLLSELDEAIKELPGSTGAQKLLITRVFEHLDRMAADAQGDRLTQLDLVDAYTRLGNIQGNEYYQNLADPAGAMVSFRKALAIARPLAESDPKDSKAVRALAMVQQSRSEILWQTGRTPEAVLVLCEAVKSLEALAADPHAPAYLIVDVAGAYSDLGDELRQPNMNSLNRPVEAIEAYRNGLRLMNRATSMDPGSMPGKRAAPMVAFKIGTVEIETDPAQATVDLQVALRYLDALRGSEQNNLSMDRLRGLTLQREANALVQLGRYTEALPLFTESLQFQQRLASADSQDWRGPADIESLLNDEAAGYEAAADPVLAAVPSDRTRSLAAAETLLTQVVALVEKGLKQEPSNDFWKAVLADAQIRLANIQSKLHSSGDFRALAKTGLASLKELAGKDSVSAAVLGHAANAFLSVEPASLKDPEFALICAEREIALSHGKTPSMLLTLAQAYRATGQMEKSVAAAQEGLALLPAVRPGNVKPNIRKLIEIQDRLANKRSFK